MPLFHIAGVTRANKSFSVAFCFIAERTQTVYKWALESLLNIFKSNNIPLPKVILTDCKQALITSLPLFAPNSHHMLCTWHIQKNLVTNTTKTIKKKQEEKQMIQHWSNLIQMADQTAFNSSFKCFASNYGPCFEDYMTSTWLPVVEKFANAWTKNIPHFEHRMTSRIEFSHAFIKSHLLGPQHSFAAVIKIILNALEAQCHKILALYHQQRITALQKIGKIFHNSHGWITHFALRRAQNNLMEIGNLKNFNL
jgi:hypothetical protein